MRKAIYGGSFDPFHEGHKQVIRNVLSQNLVDKIIVIPCKQNPLKTHKPNFQSPIERLHFIGEEIKEFGDKCKISEIELFRLSNESSYTSVTLKNLMYNDFKKDINNVNEYFIIIGVDEWNVFKKWKNYEWILNYSKVIVHPRPGIEPNWYHEKMIYLKDVESIDISSSEIRLNDFIDRLKSLNIGKDLRKIKFERNINELIDKLKGEA